MSMRAKSLDLHLRSVNNADLMLPFAIHDMCIALDPFVWMPVQIASQNITQILNGTFLALITEIAVPHADTVVTVFRIIRPFTHTHPSTSLSFILAPQFGQKLNHLLL